MSSTASLNSKEQERRLYRTIWRWHFYAGVFCIPFVIFLSITGSIYLFKPQIDRWLDRPYDHLHLVGERATPEQIALAAVAAVPNSSLHYYELPPGDDAAARVIVGVGTQEFRVYVHPVTKAILKIGDEDKRPTTLLAHLHGQLLVGRWGSYLIETAASWALVLILTGLYLWWPRQTEKLAGVLWIRLGRGQRIFWRDLHAVTGVWLSAFALFLIATGLPWANGWGAYFKEIRKVTGTSVKRQAWATGRASELAERIEMNNNSLGNMGDMPDMPGMEHSGHMGHMMHRMTAPGAYAPFDRLLPVASTLHLAPPVKIMPAMTPGGTWSIRSDSQTRTLRDVVQVDPQTGTVVSRQNFNQGMLLDRIVGVGIAAHEGQLFGPLNQLLGLITATGLCLLSVSAVVLWWRRRNVGVLGAPIPTGKPRWTFPLVTTVIALAIYLPAMAFSLILVILLEKILFSRITPVRRWLGLSPV